MSNPKMNITELRLLNRLYLNKEIAEQKFKEAATKIMEKYKQHPMEIFNLQTGEIATGEWEKMTKGNPNRILM